MSRGGAEPAEALSEAEADEWVGEGKGGGARIRQLPWLQPALPGVVNSGIISLTISSRDSAEARIVMK